jgi:NADH:ubiquinone oxidoreductase subunit K
MCSLYQTTAPIELGVIILMILKISACSFSICVGLLTQIFRLSNINNTSQGSNEKMD